MYVYMENDCLHTYYLEKYYQIPFKLKKYPLRDSETPIVLEDFLLKNFNIQEFVFSFLRMEQMRCSLYWCSNFPDSVVMRQMC